MTQARSVTVTGRVQGVGFRAFTRDVARTAGLAGWVRNREDGSVEARLEGSAEAVEAVLTRLREGPPTARVARVDATEVAPLGAAGFEIRR